MSGRIGAPRIRCAGHVPRRLSWPSRIVYAKRSTVSGPEPDWEPSAKCKFRAGLIVCRRPASLYRISTAQNPGATKPLILLAFQSCPGIIPTSIWAKLK